MNNYDHDPHNSQNYVIKLTMSIIIFVYVLCLHFTVHNIV